MVVDFILFALIGSGVGLIAGLFGFGGGILMVPALSFVYHHLHFPPDSIMKMAAATSLANMLFTSQVSLFMHRKHGTVVWPVYKKIFIGTIIGVAVGVVGAHWLHSNVLRVLFAVFLGFVSVRMLFLKEMAVTTPKLNAWASQSVGLFIGAKSGALGVGGGSLVVPYLAHANVPLPQAIAVSAAISATVAVIGTAMFMVVGYATPGLPAYSIGYVYWPAALAAVLPGMLCAPIGVRLAHRLPTLWIKRILAVLLILIAIHMLWML